MIYQATDNLNLTTNELKEKTTQVCEKNIINEALHKIKFILFQILGNYCYCRYFADKN